MSKKDFQLIASIIYSLPDDIRDKVANAFAARLRYENPRFDATKFYRACTDPEYFKHRK